MNKSRVPGKEAQLEGRLDEMREFVRSWPDPLAGANIVVAPISDGPPARLLVWQVELQMCLLEVLREVRLELHELLLHVKLGGGRR